MKEVVTDDSDCDNLLDPTEAARSASRRPKMRSSLGAATAASATIVVLIFV